LKRRPKRFLSKRGRQVRQGRISSLRLSRLFGARSGEERLDKQPTGEIVWPSVVVGLGNPGRSYARTRHNIGFLVVDELARRHDGSWRARKKAEAAPVSLNLKNVTLLKPIAYMNNSGVALAGYEAPQLIVVHDDLDLEVSTVRVKVGGGAGGHNGLRSIIQHLGSDFVRVRIGIGRPPVGGAPVDYVLGRMDEAVKEAVPRAADAVETVIESGPEAAMNRFNVRL
jgi:PTH1 family peptidyl-tRNA hydrolase